jgi:hypothetical protein
MSIFNKSDPRRSRLIRGIILHLIWLAGNGDGLNPNDPFRMARGVLTTALEGMQQLPNASDLTSAVRYCEEKGYVDVAWLSDGSGDFESLKLLVAGIDIVESTTIDPGVTIPKYR